MLKVTTETVDTREVVLTVEPDADRIDQAKRRAARLISRVRPVPGFRPGRAPLAMVERVFGAETVLNEALHSVADGIFRDAIRDADLEPYDAGEFEVESQDPLQLKIRISLPPVVDLGDYRSVRVEPEPEVVVTDEMVDEHLEELREQHAEYEPVERPALIGDQVVLEMVATVDGEEIHRDDAFEFVMSHQDQPVMLVETALGMSAGEGGERDMDFPEEYPVSELAGQPARVAFTVKQVREKILPEVDDEFARSASEYETAEELREKTREELHRELTEARETRQTDKVVRALVNHATIEYPAVAVDREIELMLGNERARLASMGFEWESYLRMIRRTEEELRSTLRPRAEERLRQRLALFEFANREGIEADDADVEAELDRYATEYGGEDTAAMRQRLVESGIAESLRGDLRSRKTVERLVALFTGPADEAAEPAEAEEPEAAEETPEAPASETAEEAPEAEAVEEAPAQVGVAEEAPPPEAAADAESVADVAVVPPAEPETGDEPDAEDGADEGAQGADDGEPA